MKRYDTTGPMHAARTEKLLDALWQCEGRPASVIAFTQSHSMLVVRVDLAEASSLTLMCLACTRTEFVPRWTVGKLVYSVVENAPHLYRLVDESCRFRVDCGAVDVTSDPDMWRRGDS
ncbi:hypothetical protein [Labilithrix luteola]|nr:hypothetical protein [Labilithrix luteola]